MPRDSASNAKPSARERRAARRPHDGDVTRCPKCHRMTFEFNTRWRIPRRKASHISIPAWMCDDAQCRFFRFARASDDVQQTSAAAREAARELRTRAQRALMESRFVRRRADRALGGSIRRKKKDE